MPALGPSQDVAVGSLVAHKAPSSHNKQGRGVQGQLEVIQQQAMELQPIKQVFLKSRDDDLCCGGFAQPRLPKGSLSFFSCYVSAPSCFQNAKQLHLCDYTV